MIFSLIKSKEHFPIHRRDSELEILLEREAGGRQ